MSFICRLCPRLCSAERSEKENLGGICKVPLSLKAARAMLHFWEEPCISGNEGSGAIFFSGCQLKCSYCQNFDVSHNNYGKYISPYELSEIFKRLESEGANNINLVSPTPYLPLIKQALSYYKPNIPIVFNSGGYESSETLMEYKDVFDIYLFDFKYFTRDRAKKYSMAENYPEIAQKSILKASELAGKPVFNEKGIMQKGVIIRHLVLPQGTNDAIKIMEWVKKNCSQNLFSLMNQYVVMPNEKHKELQRKVTKREYEKVLQKMLELDLQGYVQDESSANDNYIPSFDLSGI